MAVAAATASQQSLRWPGETAVHILIVCAIIASQIIFTPTHSTSADGTWHYRLAIDVFHGRPIYWFGVDANRFFPDFLFTVLGLLVSGLVRFTPWLYYYYTIQILAAYVALWALATRLYDDARDRLAFCVLTVSALLLLTALFPYWLGWLMEPGGHGTGLSVCIALLALALWLNKGGRMHWAGAVAFVIGASLLVASNRYLLFGYIAPLLFALGVGALYRHAAAWVRGAVATGEREGGPDTLLLLIGCTVVAAVGGYATWRFMDTLSWYRMVAGGSLPDLPRIGNLAEFLAKRFQKEYADIIRTDGETEQVRMGVQLLLVTLLAIAVYAARVARGPWSRIAENRLIYAGFTTASALGGLAFVAIMAVEDGPYHYRYLTVPVALATVFLASLLVGFRPALGRFQAAAAVAVLAGVVGVTAVRVAYRQGEVEGNRALQEGVGVLERALRRHSSAPVMRGFAEYWEAHDLTVRSDQVHIVAVEVDRLVSRRYNNNAIELCHDDFFFVLWNARGNQPKRDVIVATVGEPERKEAVNLGRYTEVEIFYYDPKVLKEKLVEPSKELVRQLYPKFKCP